MKTEDFIKKHYPEAAAELILDYPEHPEVTCANIASLVGRSRQQIAKHVVKLHGSVSKPVLKKSCKLINIDRFGYQLQTILSKMDLEKVEGSQCYTFRNLQSGKVFVIKRLVVTTRFDNYAYLCCHTPNKTTEFIMGVFGDEISILPVKPNKGQLLYFKLADFEKHRNAFHLLG